MKIQIASDLHISSWGEHRDFGRGWWQNEFLPSFKTEADVLVLAGDIVSLAPQEIAWSRARLEEFGAMYRHVVFAPGNHEFWGHSIGAGMQDLLSLEKMTLGLRVLQHGKVVEIDGVRFHGGTMWQPHSGSLWANSRKQFVDGRFISDFWNEAPACFDLLMKHLEAECRPGDVVVTHHAPSMGSVADEWVGHRDNRFFITPEAEAVMKKCRPQLWIHGHVHSTWDYKIGDTRVMANPLGYPYEGVSFNKQLVVTI